MPEMRLLANENFPKTSFRILKENGFDIKHVGESNPSISDIDVMTIAHIEDRIILTFDSDYGKLIFDRKLPSVGVVYFRIKEFSPETPAEIFLQLLERQTIVMTNQFTVIDEERVRQRQILSENQ